MSHLTADAVFVGSVSRETPDVTPCHASPPQGVATEQADRQEGGHSEKGKAERDSGRPAGQARLPIGSSVRRHRAPGVLRLDHEGEPHGT